MKAPVILSDIPSRLFAIGDIHGCAKELDVMLNYLSTDLKFTNDDILVFLGDYIDRGPQSAGVVDAVISWKKKYPRTIALMGNHEQFLLKTLSGNFEAAENWWKNGGKETLESYGLSLKDIENLSQRLPPHHLDFFTNQIDRYVISEKTVLVHAGLNPDLPLLTQPDEAILWIRDVFLAREVTCGKTVIFGHTPQEKILIQTNKIGIDTGCVYGGSLSMILLPDVSTKSLTHYLVAKDSAEVRSLTHTVY